MIQQRSSRENIGVLPDSLNARNMQNLNNQQVNFYDPVDDDTDCNLTESLNKKSEIDGGEKYIATE